MIRMLARMWTSLRALIRDLGAASTHPKSERSDARQAQVDDTADAVLDDDGIDATGL